MDWNEGTVVSIVKRGEGEKEGVKDYRGITLTQTAYRVYASVLAERLKKDVEGRELLPCQAGFRKNRGAMDTYTC